MHRLALLVLFTTTMSMQAKEPDYRSFFTYPDIQITMDFGTNVGHSQAIPFKNHTIPKTPDEIIVFQSGCQFSGNRPDNPTVQWRYLMKTESGDLYLFSIYQKEHLIKEVPVLYTGSSVIAYDRDNISVTLEPTQGAKWKAP
jgi:hypothetical protein